MRRVLIVDDVATVRSQIARALDGIGAEILEAADGAEALEVLSESPVAIVVSDVRMPRLDGLALLRELRLSKTPVILHSGYADVAAAVEALRLGAIDFLPAPLDFERLRRRVEHYLDRDEVASGVLIGSSGEMEQIRDIISQVSNRSEPVLISGETGVGKEVVARAIHGASSRRSGPFVAVNMAALPEGLLESELFGHERGAFTGAISRQAGRFEQCQGGTILLDEIGDAPLRVQAELLRVVESRSFERLGSSQSIQIDARILAATNRELPKEIARGRFREDLWYRLAGLRIHIPPLCERRRDIDLLVRHELQAISEEWGSIPFELDDAGAARLRAHDWPGNVRELKQTVRRMAILAGGRRLLDGEDVERAILLDEFALEDSDADSRTRRLNREAEPISHSEFEDRERAEILSALNANRWNVSAAARQLGLSRGALRRRMDRARIDRAGDRDERSS